MISTAAGRPGGRSPSRCVRASSTRRRRSSKDAVTTGHCTALRDSVRGVEPELHPDLAPVAFLLGTWQGHGKGSYPTIDTFEYDEEVRFWHVGKPLLSYTQRTWHPAKGFAMHAEMGYWRVQPEGRIEIVLAHPTGI